jgi:hypothetical protein
MSCFLNINIKTHNKVPSMMSTLQQRITKHQKNLKELKYLIKLYCLKQQMIKEFANLRL